MSERDAGDSTPEPSATGRRCGRCGAVNARADAIVCISCGALLAAYDAPAGSTEIPESVADIAGPDSSPPRPTSVIRPGPSDDPAVNTPQPAPTPPPPWTPAAGGSQAAVSPPILPTTPPPTLPPSRAPRPHAASSAPAAAKPTPARGTTKPASPRPTEPAPVADGPEEDRPEPENVTAAPSPPLPRRSSRPPARPAPDYPARNLLTRQTPQTVLITGISLLLLVCVMAAVLAGTGANIAAGFFIICGGPLALLILGIGIVLLITRSRGDRF